MSASEFKISNLSVIAFSGDDAGDFLQGQLSCDVRNLDNPRALQFGSYCSHRGRMLASFLIHKLNETYRLIISSDIKDKIFNRLKLYVLRSKVQLKALNIHLIGCFKIPPEQYCSQPLKLRISDNNLYLNDFRFIRYSEEDLETGQNQTFWDRADILDGIFWVSEDTFESYVPQMCNFDAFGSAISFKKGCYVGQEVIARLRYLGSVKRRVFIFRTKGSTPNILDPIKNSEDKDCGEVVAAAGDLLLAQLRLSPDINFTELKVNDSTLESLPLPYEFPAYNSSVDKSKHSGQ